MNEDGDGCQKSTDIPPSRRTEEGPFEAAGGEILAWLGHLKIRLVDPTAFLVCCATWSQRYACMRLTGLTLLAFVVAALRHRRLD